MPPNSWGRPIDAESNCQRCTEHQQDGCLQVPKKDGSQSKLTPTRVRWLLNWWIIQGGGLLIHSDQFFPQIRTRKEVTIACLTKRVKRPPRPRQRRRDQEVNICITQCHVGRSLFPKMVLLANECWEDGSSSIKDGNTKTPQKRIVGRDRTGM